MEPNIAPNPFVKSLDKLRKRIIIDAGCPDPITRDNYYNRVVMTIRIKLTAGKISLPTLASGRKGAAGRARKNADSKGKRYVIHNNNKKVEVDGETASYQDYTFSFLLNCDLYDMHKNFEYGYIFLSLLGLLIVVVVSIHPRIYSIRFRNNVPLSV